jgi:hypothetical protein
MYLTKEQVEKAAQVSADYRSGKLTHQQYSQRLHEVSTGKPTEVTREPVRSERELNCSKLALQLLENNKRKDSQKVTEIEHNNTNIDIFREAAKHNISQNEILADAMNNLEKYSEIIRTKSGEA